ncbi:DUF4136 domain-containing protein [Alteromonadaceae bacterium M269]|nr:DUF4136 domain-containing protein [Alteromonadaceae bacterium M269]
MTRVFALISILILSACATQSPVELSTSVDQSASNYTYYYWEPDTKRRAVPELAAELVRKTDEILAQKGYEKTSKEKAEFALAYDITAENKGADVTTQRNFDDYGPGVSCKDGECESTNEIHRTKQRNVKIVIEGTIDLHATSIETGELIWQGKSKKQLSFDYDPDIIDRPLNVAKEKRSIDWVVKKMLEKVPDVE